MSLQDQSLKVFTTSYLRSEGKVGACSNSHELRLNSVSSVSKSQVPEGGPTTEAPRKQGGLSVLFMVTSPGHSRCSKKPVKERYRSPDVCSAVRALRCRVLKPRVTSYCMRFGGMAPTYDAIEDVSVVRFFCKKRCRQNLIITEKLDSVNNQKEHGRVYATRR